MISKSVKGSGDAGRVMRRDVEAASAPGDNKRSFGGQGKSAPAPPAAPARRHLHRRAPRAVAGERTEERVRMSKRRATIAKRLIEAQSTAAMLTTFNEVDMSAVQALRARHKETFKERHGVNLGMTSFFVKAVIGALRAFPRINAEIQGDEMVMKRYYDIGIAVGASEGLVVPVLRDADLMSFAEIEGQTRAFAKKAEDGTLSLADLKGGTFTITNGGVFGSLQSTPILNPPQVGILGLHAIKDRPVAVDGQVVIRPMMYTALTYDHRIVDGSEAVRFLVRVKELDRGSGGAAARVGSARMTPDLKVGPTNEDAVNEISRIVDQLEREHAGDPWHGSPLSLHPRRRDAHAGGREADALGAQHLGARAPHRGVEERSAPPPLGCARCRTAGR